MAYLYQDAAVYCGTYHKYNCGSLYGKWMKFTDYADADEFFEACRELHKDEEDPEFMFQDFECFPKIMYNESMGHYEVEKIYELLNENSSVSEEIFEAWIEASGVTKYGFDPVEQLNKANENYFCDENDTSYAEEQIFAAKYIVEHAFGLDKGQKEFISNLLDEVDITNLQEKACDNMYSANGYFFWPN